MTADQQDLLSAALRHVRDAEALLPPSPDQAWHLAGFGPECARKACLTERWADRVVGHKLDQAAEAIIETAVALDAHALRYRLEGWSSRGMLARWTPEARYQRTNTTTPDDAAALCDDARQILLEVVTRLWADGALDTPEI